MRSDEHQMRLVKPQPMGTRLKPELEMLNYKKKKAQCAKCFVCIKLFLIYQREIDDIGNIILDHIKIKGKPGKV